MGTRVGFSISGSSDVPSMPTTSSGLIVTLPLAGVVVEPITLTVTRATVPVMPAAAETSARSTYGRLFPGEVWLMTGTGGPAAAVGRMLLRPPDVRFNSNEISAEPTVVPRVSSTTVNVSVSPRRADHVVTPLRSSGPVVDGGTDTNTESLDWDVVAATHVSPTPRAVMRPAASTVATVTARLVNVTVTPGTGLPAASAMVTVGVYAVPMSRMRTFSVAVP